jgi:uncharacterized protein (DUF924 family)
MIDEVLAFWFGAAPTTTEEYGKQIRRWFMGGPALDEEIRARFAPVVEQAFAGALDDWANTTRGRLALILVLDQFSRSIYRDQPQMYAGDPKAQALTVEALARGLQAELPVVQRHFLVMPLLHAENLDLQERGVVAMREVHDAGEPWQREMLKMGTEQSIKYRDLIARFGRFPHRNKILGRANTPEEDAFLVDWAAKQPPSGMKAL